MLEDEKLSRKLIDATVGIERYNEKTGGVIFARFLICRTLSLHPIFSFLELFSAKQSVNGVWRFIQNIQRRLKINFSRETITGLHL